MGWREKLDQSAQAKIEEQWPKVQQLFQEKVGLAALAAAKSDDAMQMYFKTVYEALPLPLRLAVTEDVIERRCRPQKLRNRIICCTQPVSRKYAVAPTKFIWSVAQSPAVNWRIGSWRNASSRRTWTRDSLAVWTLALPRNSG